MARSLNLFDDHSVMRESDSLNLEGWRVHEDVLQHLTEKFERIELTQETHPIEASHDLSCYLVRLLQSEFSARELRDLLEDRGDPQMQIQEKLGGIFLHWAVSQRRSDVITKLLQHGVDPFVPNDDGFSALYMAQCRHDLASFRVLERSMSYFSANVIIHGDEGHAEMKWMDLVPLVREPSKSNWNVTILIRAHEEDLEPEELWAVDIFRLAQVFPQTSSFCLKHLYSGETKHLTVFAPQRGAFQKLNELLEKHCAGEKNEILATIQTFERSEIFICVVLVILFYFLFPMNILSLSL